MKNILTNRTLAAFEKWYYENHCKSSIKFEDLLLWQKAEVFDWLYSQCETIQYAFAVEFFDSVKIAIGIEITRVKDDYGFDFVIYYDSYGKSFTNNDFFFSRKDCAKKALEKANEIFNNR